jgi:hypothetical protein
VALLGRANRPLSSPLSEQEQTPKIGRVMSGYDRYC